MSASDRSKLIRQVADMLVAGEWTDEWALELGVTPEMVRMAGELIEMSMDVARVMRTAAWGLTQLARDARRAGDYSAAVSALSNLARITGAAAPDRVDVNDARELESMRAELMAVAARHPEVRGAMVRALGGGMNATEDDRIEVGGDSRGGGADDSERAVEADDGQAGDVDG